MSNPSLAKLKGFTPIGEGGTPEIQVEAMQGEAYDGVFYHQPCGIHTIPLPESDVVLVPLNGGRSLAVGFVDDIASELTSLNALALQAGETVLYAQGGSRIILRLGGVVELQAPTSFTVTSPIFTVNSTTVNLNGVLNTNSEPYLGHRHQDVQAGASLSGVVD
jgi:phage gp45-like